MVHKESAFPPPFCGQNVTHEHVAFIQDITQRYGSLSRTEIAATVCELLGWVRHNGKPKTVEGLAYLEKLAEQQAIALPEARKCSTKRMAVKIPGGPSAAPTPVEDDLRQLPPITLQRVTHADQRNTWRSLVDQHHYLGHKIPFGAHLRYFIQAGEQVLGCLQFSSPAWRIQCRDHWIGWNEQQRKMNLQHIVCNSRFLILPWVKVPNLASHVLAKSVDVLAADWQEQYHLSPWLLESLVDSSRFTGVCYRAANWVLVGQTSGRGRDDRAHRRHGAAPKQVWLYPLEASSRDRLRGERP